jgi:hypothetical protein
MKTPSFVFNFCLLLTLGSLGFGYLSAGYWQVLVAFLFLAILWIFARKRSQFWAAAIILLGAVLLAALGIMVNLPPVLMIIACSSGLVCWDLYLFNGEMPENLPPHVDAMLTRNHMQALAMAASMGFVLAFSGAFIRFELPFWSIVLLVLIVVGCLLYSIQYLNKSR